MECFSSAVGVMALAAVLAADDFTEFPIADAHNHVMPGLRPESLVSWMDRAGVRKIVLMPVGRAASFEERHLPALDAVEKYPDRVLPFIGLNGIRTFPPPLLEKLDRMLASGRFRGMGELLLRHYPFERTSPGGTPVQAGDFAIPADSDEVNALLELAAKHDVVLTIHMETTSQTVPALERALQRNPKARVIWAHQNPLKTLDGFSAAHARKASPGQLAAMLDKFPNLHADIALGYESLFLEKPDGQLPGAWKDLYEQHSDRFLVGMDMPFLAGWEEGAYLRRTRIVRAWLSQLTPATREKLAIKNLERIVGGN